MKIMMFFDNFLGIAYSGSFIVGMVTFFIWTLVTLKCGHVQYSMENGDCDDLMFYSNNINNIKLKAFFFKILLTGISTMALSDVSLLITHLVLGENQSFTLFKFECLSQNIMKTMIKYT